MYNIHQCKMPSALRTITAMLLMAALTSWPTTIFGQGNKLKTLSYFSIDGEEQPLNEDSLLKGYISIERITKQQFLAKKPMAVNFVSKDSTGIKKRNGVLKLPIKTGIKKFIDRSPFSESKQEYTYLGQVPFLNMYIVGGLYWEDLDYKFISKLNGDEVQSFAGFPCISPKKQYIISMFANPYDAATDFELFKLVDGKPQNIFRAGFNQWMPAGDNNSMFWANDGKLYLPMLPPSKFWKKNGDLNDAYQYIRISVL